MHTTVATLIIAPIEVTEMAVDMFRQTTEIDSIVSARYQDIVKNPRSFIPSWKVKKAKKMYPGSKVSVGYLFKYILRQRNDITKELDSIPDTHRIICQVETPTVANRRYKNIDIGFTSNGKIETSDVSLMSCSIRETLEEARIQLTPRHYCPISQTIIRQKNGMHAMPLHFSNDNVFCFIICM
jgi:hypothetical protein